MTEQEATAQEIHGLECLSDSLNEDKINIGIRLIEETQYNGSNHEEVLKGFNFTTEEIEYIIDYVFNYTIED